MRLTLNVPKPNIHLGLFVQVFRNSRFFPGDQKFCNRQRIRKLPLTHTQKRNLTPQLATAEMKRFLCQSLNLLSIGYNCSVRQIIHQQASCMTEGLSHLDGKDLFAVGLAVDSQEIHRKG